MSTIIDQPLTTVFTPAAHCATDAWTWGNTTGSTTIYQNYLASSAGSECFPSGIDAWPTIYRYSPGICPLGFSTAHTSIIEGSITGAQCCPTGYEGDGKPWSGSLEGCFKSYTTTTTVYHDIDVPGELPLGPVGPGVAMKFQVVVFHQSSDLSLFPSDYTLGTTAPAQTSAASSSNPGSTPVETGSGANPHETLAGQTSGGGTGGLSTEAKAGIGAGVAVGVLAALSILFFFFWRHRRGSRTNTLPEKPELDASSVGKCQRPVVAELQAHDPTAGRHELRGTQVQEEFKFPEELPAHTTSELPGPDTVSPADLSPAELAGRSVVQTAAPVPSATEESTPVSPPAQHGHSPPSGHQPLSQSELSPTTAAATSANEPSAQASGIQAMPTTIEELELQYLDSQAKRIQQRKEEILRARESKIGEGS